MGQQVVDVTSGDTSSDVRVGSARWTSWLLSLRERLQDDWHDAKYYPGAVLLALVSGVVTLAYYINHSQPESYPDTPTYLHAALHIATLGQFADVVRTPGYPVLVNTVFLVAGSGNLAAVAAAQGALFVVTSLTVYALMFQIFYRSWVALLAGALVGTNTYLLSYVKPVLSEAVTLWLVSSLTLAVVLYLREARRRDLWIVAFLCFALFMTRFEWAYLPLLLVPYFLLVAARRGTFRRVLPHAAVALLLLYGSVGAYYYANGTENGFWGITDIQNINLLGKVMQYHMEDEAPAQYQSVATLVHSYVARNVLNPYIVLSEHRYLGQSDNALAGAYAMSIIKAHPIEFIVNTLETIPSTYKVISTISQIDPAGPLGGVLLVLQKLSRVPFIFFPLFPLCALGWLAALCLRQTTRLRLVEKMGAIVLIASYGLLLTTAGGYDVYMRFHIPFDPVMYVVLISTIYVACRALVPVVAPVLRSALRRDGTAEAA